jgi:hypothetical protein
MGAPTDRGVGSAMIEHLNTHRFRRDIERIAGVGVDYLVLVVEEIGLELGCLDDVRRIVQEFSEIIPDPGGDLHPPAPPGAA